jgi:ankyrin repeat protein
MFKLLGFLTVTIHANPLYAESQIDYDLFIEAVRGCDIAIIEIMLAEGFDINSADSEGWTALHWSNFTHELNEQKHNELLRLLIRNGANVNAQGKSGRTSLIMLLEPGSDQISPPPLEAIKLYLDSGTDITIEDENGRTAYEIGIGSEYPQVQAYFKRTDSK